MDGRQVNMLRQKENEDAKIALNNIVYYLTACFFRFGRKPTIIVCAVGGVIGISKIFLNSFYAYIGVEFLESFVASGIYTVAIVWSKY